MNKFAERLSEILQTTEWTQQKLANKLQTTQQTVSRWTKGHREPNFDMFMRICRHLEETPEYMLGYDEPNIIKDIDEWEEENTRLIEWEKTQQEQEEEQEEIEESFHQNNR